MTDGQYFWLIIIICIYGTVIGLLLINGFEDIKQILKEKNRESL